MNCDLVIQIFRVETRNGLKFVFYLMVAPHLAGFLFKLFVGILEMPVIGSFVVSKLKKQNKIEEVF